MYKCFSGREAPMFLSTQHFAARKQKFLVLGSDSHPLDSLTHILLNPPNIFSRKSEYVRSMFGCRLLKHREKNISLLVNIPPVRLASLSSPRNTVAGGTFLGDPAHCVFARHTSKKCREKPKGLDPIGSTQNSRSQFSWPSWKNIAFENFLLSLVYERRAKYTDTLHLSCPVEFWDLSSHLWSGDVVPLTILASWPCWTCISSHPNLLQRHLQVELRSFHFWSFPQIPL